MGVGEFMGYFALGEIPEGADRPRLAQAFADRTSIEAQIILVLCKRLRAVGSVAGRATCLGQAKPVVDEVLM